MLLFAWTRVSAQLVPAGGLVWFGSCGNASLDGSPIASWCFGLLNVPSPFSIPPPHTNLLSKVAFSSFAPENRSSLSSKRRHLWSHGYRVSDLTPNLYRMPRLRWWPLWARRAVVAGAGLTSAAPKQLLCACDLSTGWLACAL